MTAVQKYGRKHFAVVDGNGDLLAVCLYKKGAEAVAALVEYLEVENERLRKEVHVLRAEQELRTASPQLPLFGS